MSDRTTVTILGRTLGTASGWDGDPGECIVLYDFEPLTGIDLPKGDLTFDEVNDTLGPHNAVEFLSTIPRDVK
jgi:hypothetical protein